MGSLQDIVASNLVDDASTPSVVKNTDWIKPGVASWNYWSSNHGTKSFKIVKAFADLAVEMNWPYTLLDWEWDSMTDGGNVEDAAKYILSKGIKPLIWYNSGGNHTWVSSTPKDRMLTHENRVAEFTKLKKMGFVGVKIDFFESEKQDMIKYYLDILKDAATYQIMVYFHGCLVPRGWSRTYPHLMTYEAVRGAEWYNNGPEFTMTAPEHNTILPFTRNVVGPMDYTPVTFTNSQFPHSTSYGHELALSIVFESGLQHMADRPQGYQALPDTVKNFLKTVPNAWDGTKMVEGYPGKYVVMARRKGATWYVGSINGENRELTQKVQLPFLQNGTTYRCTLIADGEHDKVFQTRSFEINNTGSLNVKVLRRGGYVAVFTPVTAR
jgi:alpha-glucosidase